MENPGAQQPHNDPGDGDAGQDSQNRWTKLHIQYTSGQGSGPRAGSGDRDSYKKQQRRKQSASRFGLELLAASVPLQQAPAEQPSNYRFVRAPDQ